MVVISPLGGMHRCRVTIGTSEICNIINRDGDKGSDEVAGLSQLVLWRLATTEKHNSYETDSPEDSKPMQKQGHPSGC